MKAIIALGGLLFMAVAGWQLGGRLSSDAIGMALGVLFGIMAGIPASLMVLAARRNDMGRGFDEDEFEQPRRGRQQQQQGQFPMGYGQLPQQPPVIVVAGQGMAGQQGGYVQNGYPQGAYAQNGYPQQGYGMHPGEMPPGQMTIEGPVGAPQQREFRVVGEVEETLEPWQ